MIVVNFSGGLGNQMFQYALYKKFKTLGNDVKADISFYTMVESHNGFEIDKVFGLNLIKADQGEILSLKDTSNFLRKYRRRLYPLFWKKTHKEQLSFDFDKKVLNFDEAYLNGYWQSEKYFLDIKEEIKKDFTFKDLDIPSQNVLESIKNCNAISIHIRRGDYVSDAATKDFLGNICNVDYYNRALEYIYTNKEITNPEFFIFSDDIQWAKDNLKIKNKAHFININQGNRSWQDMCLMSNCKHNIIANSSFSWWAAYLNSNDKKIIICPNRWVNNDRRFRRLNSPDIIPNTWKKI